MPDDPTIPNATCPPFSGASARDLLAGILLASGGDPANIPNTTQCREWGYGRYTERDILAAILLATGTGGGGGVWGSITGTLSDQTDLQTALNGKLGVSAQAADVNPAGTAISAALGLKLNLTGGTLSGLLSFSGTTHAGIRLNNLTTVERNALASPLAGMILWNTTTSRLNVHNGSAWTDGFVRLAGDTMTGALGVNLASVTGNTNPSLGETLFDLQIGGVSQMRVFARTASLATLLLPADVQSSSSTLRIRAFSASGYGIEGVTITSTGQVSLSGGHWTFSTSGGAVSTTANLIELRNGGVAQALRIFGTFTDASNYRRINLSMSTAGVAVLKAEGAGTGASGNVLHISSLPTSNPGPGILWDNAGTPAIGT